MSKQDTQRTRGNLKPMSSGSCSDQRHPHRHSTACEGVVSSAKAASATTTPLIHTNDISLFAILSREASEVGGGGTNDNSVDHDLDPELRVILLKLTKKDSTTKIRAFNELRDYCDANESDEAIRAILPFFVRQYRQWSTDQDQHVRDECQSTFDTIGMRMKNNLSPHLRFILPSWLMAQCDSYAPAASKARFLYRKLFNNEAKQAAVVYFGRKEIMLTLTDEINECYDVVKDKRANEMETDDAHEQRLTQVLLALALFLNYFDPNKRVELTDQFKLILNSDKFWKLDKIKSIQIQISFYHCLYDLIKLVPDNMREYITKIVPLVFYAVNEIEPKLCPLIWDCLILCLDTFDNCWSLVNYQKAFLPKLWTFFRHGNIFGVKDCLLALISKIPANVLDDKKNYHFIDNFFQSMEKRILSMKGRQQMNNINSLLKAYMDCLLYILEHHSSDQLKFLNNRILPLIRLLLVDKNCSIRNIYARQYVYMLSSLQSFRLYRDHLNSILALFRDLITNSTLQSPMTTTIELKYSFEQATVLFETILSPLKSKNLRFASTDLSSIDSATFRIDDEEIDENNNKKDTYLIQLAISLCRLCFEFCTENNMNPTFEHSLDLFIRLLNCSTSNMIEIISKLTDKTENSNPILELFYLNYAKPLLKISIERHCSLDQIVEWTIQTLHVFNSTELVVEQFLADLIQLESSRHFYFLLASIVCRYESTPAFHSWLQKHGVLEELLNMTATVFSQTSDLSLPVSAEEFQLLSSLLCSDKSTQFLSSIQQEQVVYLACRLFEQQIRLSVPDQSIQQQQQLNHIGMSNSSSIDNGQSDDLRQSIDRVARHLFKRIDSTFTNRCTQDLFKLYFESDLNYVILKNNDASQHQRRLWFLAVERAKTMRNIILGQIAQYCLGYINTQSDNELFTDMIIAICVDVDNLQSSSSLSEILHTYLLERISFAIDFVCESWIYGTLHGWLLPRKTTILKVDVDERSREVLQQQRMIDVQFVSLLVIRQYELSCHLWPIASSQLLIRKLVSNLYFFKHRRIDVNHLRILLERLFHSGSFKPEFQLIDCLATSSTKDDDLYTEILYYHTYCTIKETYLQVNERDDDLHFTFTLDNNDEINFQIILCSHFRESQLKLLIPYLIEQCSDQRCSSLTLAALNQCLIRANHCGIILDDDNLQSILDLLIKLTTSSIETFELVQLWNTLLNHGTFVHSFKQKHWNNVLCFISNLFQNLTDVRQQVESQVTLMTKFLFVYASNLLTTIGKLLTIDDQNNELFSKQLTEEWLQFYSKEIYQRLLPFYVALPSALPEFSSFYVTYEMVKAICLAMCTVPTSHLLNNQLRPFFHPEDTQLNLPASIQSVFNHLYRLLSSTPNRFIQYSSYTLITKLLPHIAQTLILTDNDEAIAEDNKTCRLPGSMIETLERTKDTIEQLLADNDFVEEHRLDDEDEQQLVSHSSSPAAAMVTDKEHIIVAELLTYKLLLNFIGCYSTVEQRYSYTLMLHKKQLIDRVLSIVLDLIPANPVYINLTSIQISSITKTLSHSKSMFENEIQLHPSAEIDTPYTIPHLACSVYLQCLSSIPILVREWYLNQQKPIRDAVDRVTQIFVSPILIQRELDSVSSITHSSTDETGVVTSIHAESIARSSTKSNEVSQLTLISTNTGKQMTINSRDLLVLKHNDRETIRIISLDMTNESPFLNEHVEHFTNGFKFVARVLSIKDKIQFLLISATIAEWVVPLIHRHFSVERIYLYSSSNNPLSYDWAQSYPKVVSCWIDNKGLFVQIAVDMDLWSKRPLVWNRSNKLFTMIDCQKIDIHTTLILQVSTKMANNDYLIIFHCQEPLFHASGDQNFLKEFTDIDACAQFVTEQSESHVFLVISDDIRSSRIESILNLKQIHALYYFRTGTVLLPMNTRTVSGHFDDLEQLAVRLRHDLHFSREQRLHAPQIRIFPSDCDLNEKLIPQFNDRHIEFLIFKLFVDILTQIPTLTFTLDEIMSEWKDLFVEPTNDCQNFIQRMIRNNISIVDNDSPTILKFVSSFAQERNWHNLLMFARPLGHMYERASQLNPKATSSLTVYRAEIVLKKDLQMLKSSCNALISMIGVLCTTRSQTTACTIARQAANNGLVSILFEIELLENSPMICIDNERMMFRVGTIFRLNSFDQGSDNVWYAKMYYADSDIQPIIEQLQFDIGTPLSWLTFGNYLYELNRFSDAKDYYEVLLQKLPKDHPDLPSIYNNIGLMYTKADEQNEASRYYDWAEQYAKSISHATIERTKNREQTLLLPVNNQFSLNTIMDRAAIFEHMADIYFENKDEQLALDNYEKALESCTNEHRCRIYEKIISHLLAKNSSHP